MRILFRAILSLFAVHLGCSAIIAEESRAGSWSVKKESLLRLGELLTVIDGRNVVVPKFSNYVLVYNRNERPCARSAVDTVINIVNVSGLRFDDITVRTMQPGV